MNKTIFILPMVKRNPLRCTWIKTGDPERLACVWARRDLRIAAKHEHRATGTCPLCA